AVGLSNHDATQLEKAEKLGHVQSLQPPFSLIRRNAAAADIPWCHTHETGVIVYGPMQAGLLSGTFTAERAAKLPDTDWRKRSDEFKAERLEKNLALAGALRPIAAKRKTSVGAIAIAWTLSWPGVTGAIVGARSPEQVDGWVDAASLELDRSELQAIANA